MVWMLAVLGVLIAASLGAGVAVLIELRRLERLLESSAELELRVAALEGALDAEPPARSADLTDSVLEMLRYSGSIAVDAARRERRGEGE